MTYKTNKITVYQGDCLEVMPTLPDKSADMILCDLPYGTTACAWDTVIPFESLWKEYKRLIKDNGAIVLTASQPFTSLLICSNLKMFKYCWYWRKSRLAGFVNAKLKPLKDIEDVVVFSFGTTANKSKRNMPYFPQGLVEANELWKRPKRYLTNSGVNPTRKNHTLQHVIPFKGYPRQVLDFSMHNGTKQVHPTQKPVALFEYLIRTYTNEGDTVLDNCAGSGTTGIACLNTSRRAILIEKDPVYYEVIKTRLQTHQTSDMRGGQSDIIQRPRTPHPRGTVPGRLVSPPRAGDRRVARVRGAPVPEAALVLQPPQDEVLRPSDDHRRKRTTQR